MGMGDGLIVWPLQECAFESVFWALYECVELFDQRFSHVVLHLSHSNQKHEVVYLKPSILALCCTQATESLALLASAQSLRGLSTLGTQPAPLMRCQSQCRYTRNTKLYRSRAMVHILCAAQQPVVKTNPRQPHAPAALSRRKH